MAAYAARNADLARNQIARFLDGLEPADDVILDAGCGPGRDLVRFGAAGHCTVGVDLNDDFLAAADATADGYPVRVERGDLRALPFGRDSFAATWACASLVHLDHVGAVAAHAEIARVARPGGRVYVSVKCSGPAGWVDTPHGRRWFHIWEPDVFAGAATAAGLHVTDYAVDGVFVDLWATA